MDKCIVLLRFKQSIELTTTTLLRPRRRGGNPHTARLFIPHVARPIKAAARGGQEWHRDAEAGFEAALLLFVPLDATEVRENRSGQVGPAVGPASAFSTVFPQECMGQFASSGPT